MHQHRPALTAHTVDEPTRTVDVRPVKDLHQAVVEVEKQRPNTLTLRRYRLIIQRNVFAVIVAPHLPVVFASGH